MADRANREGKVRRQEVGEHDPDEGADEREGSALGAVAGVVLLLEEVVAVATDLVEAAHRQGCRGGGECHQKGLHPHHNEPHFRVHLPVHRLRIS